MTTQTGKVGFVGGMQSVVIDQFEWGYKAGVEYANKTQGKNVTVDVQYLESFGDAAKGKATATKMYSDGCDIVFHAAGALATASSRPLRKPASWSSASIRTSPASHPRTF